MPRLSGENHAWHGHQGLIFGPFRSGMALTPPAADAEWAAGYAYKSGAQRRGRGCTWNHPCMDGIWSHKIRWDHLSWKRTYKRGQGKHWTGRAGVWTGCKPVSYKSEESDGPRLWQHRTTEDLKASVLPFGITATPNSWKQSGFRTSQALLLSTGYWVTYEYPLQSSNYRQEIFMWIKEGIQESDILSGLSMFIQFLYSARTWPGVALTSASQRTWSLQARGPREEVLAGHS